MSDMKESDWERTLMQIAIIILAGSVSIGLKDSRYLNLLWLLLLT